MKKKIFVIVAAFMLLFGVTGQAMAYFTDYELIQVVSDLAAGSNKEVLTDLGHFNSTTYTGAPMTITAPNFSLSQFPGATYSNLEVQYYVLNLTDTPNSVWTSGPTTGQM